MAWANEPDSTQLLIADMTVQIEATEAMNAMYNFNFEEARIQYNWLMQKYPESPLSYFLLGLSEWWKMLPDSDVQLYDEAWPEPQCKCDDCGAEKIHLIEKENG